MLEKWDVHTHTTLSPATFSALSRYSHYSDFIRVRACIPPACGAELVNSLGQVQRKIESNAYEGSARIRDCDKHGVSMQVLSPTPMMIPDYVDNPEHAADICKILNDSNARTVEEYPQRFTALGALPMRSAPHAIKEMERIQSLGMKGVEINSNIEGRDLDHPDFFPIFQAASDLNLAIFIHPWGGFMSPREASLKQRMHADYNWRPWLIAMGMETALAFDALRSAGVHEHLPHLRVLYAHGGGMFPSLLGRLEHGAYCRPDYFAHSTHMTPYQVVSSCGVYVDSLTHDPWALAQLVEILGVDRIALGSDYPYPLGEIDSIGKRGQYPGHMIEHLPTQRVEMEEAWKHFSWIPPKHARHLPCLSLAQKQRMLAGTAKEWLQWN